MTRRGLALFALMSVVWGVPYLLIKVAVRDLSPAMVVEGRTLIGAGLLLPLAWRQGRVRPLLAAWKPLAAYCVCELAVPWYLLSNAEKRLPSSLSGLLVATVPLVSVAVVAASRIRLRVRAGAAGGAPVPASGPRHLTERVDGRQIAGLLVGLGGVAVLLGLDVHGAQLGSVAQVLVVAVGYALGPAIASRYLHDQSSLALAAVSLAVVALAYVPPAWAARPSAMPRGTVVAAVVTLGVVCTALAFVAFFELLKEMPPTRATVITYFNPVVAVIFGVAVLGEAFRWSTGLGFAFILAGSWFATGRGGEPSGADPASAEMAGGAS